MHWLSILTALTYALILAFLVVIKGWVFQEAAIAARILNPNLNWLNFDNE